MPIKSQNSTCNKLHFCPDFIYGNLIRYEKNYIKSSLLLTSPYFLTLPHNTFFYYTRYPGCRKKFHALITVILARELNLISSRISCIRDTREGAKIPFISIFTGILLKNAISDVRLVVFLFCCCL